MEKIPFLNLVALYRRDKEAFDQAIESVLEQGSYIGGKELNQFEAAFAAYISGDGGSTVCGCANGTDALYLAVRALELPAGSEALVPAMTYVATVEALIHAGIRVKLVDVDPRNGLMDPQTLRAQLTPHTKLIVPVHLYGQMAPMDEIAAIARAHGALILEDCAQAHGARWKGHPAGFWGDICAYSFYPGKNLGAFGDAGAVLSRNPLWIETCRAIANHGGIKKYVHEKVGINSRLDNLQAAVLGVKLPRLEEWNAARRRVAGWYREGLSGLPGLKLLEEHPQSLHVYHLFVVCVEDREALQAYLSSQQIDSGIHYPKAIHQLPAYQGQFQGDFPHAEYLAQHGLSLPMCPTLTEAQVARVVDSVRNYFKNG